MGSILGRLYYIITGDTAGLNRSLRSSRKEMEALGSQLNTLSRSFLSFAKGTMTAALIASFTEAASRMDELQNKFDTVFRGIASDTEEWVEAYAEATNRGRIETMEFLSSQQDVRTGFGDTVEGAAEFSKAVVGIANDLSSFSNIPVTEAIAAVNSGLNGEFEALRRLGVGLNVAIINQMDYAKAIGKTWDEMGNLERQEAVLSGIVTQSANALHQNITVWQDYDYTLGDAALTAESFANQVQGFRGTLTDFRAEIGDELIPAAEMLLGGVTSLMRGFNELDDSLQTLIVTAASAAAAFALIGGPVGIAAAAVTALTVGLTNIRTPAERIEDTMEDLTEAAEDYSEATRRLSTESETLTEKQRALLEAEVELSKARAGSSLAEFASQYGKTLKDIEEKETAFLEAQADYDAADIMKRFGLDKVDRIIRDMERLGEESLDVYDRLLLESLRYFQEDRNESESFISSELLRREKVMKESSEAFHAAVVGQEEDLGQLAIYYNQGVLSLENYESVYPELCEEIRNAAAELKKQEEAAAGSTDEIDRASATSHKWRDELRELAVDIFNDEGMFQEALKLRTEMIRSEQEEAIRALAMDSALIQSGENAADISIEELRRRIEANADANAELIALDEYYNQEIISAEEDAAEREIEIQQRKAEEIKSRNREMFSSILSFARDYSSALGNIFSAMTERRLQQIDDETDATLEALGLQEDTEIEKLRKEYTEAVKNGDMELAQEKERDIQRAGIEEEAEERKKRIQNEQAKREKALAIFQATIDTLASVIGFMNDPGGLSGAAMSAMAAATGAAQIAAITAEPLPSYAVGAVDIDRDQIAQLHQGELVVPKTFAEGIRDGDISIGGSESRVEVTIINNSGVKATAERLDDKDVSRLRITIGDAVASDISKGRFDSAMMQRFSITRRNQRG